MTEENNTTNNMQTNKPIELVRKFEIAVYEEDVKDDGSVKWNQASYKQPVIIEAKNPNELNEKLNLYKRCGQKAKVVREIDPPSKELIEAYISQQKQSQNIQTQPSIHQPIQHEVQTVKQTIVEQPIQVTKAVVTKPKIYRIGDLEIKDDNGKIYQKQWMKLTDNEASNIRLVNDKNNALVNLNGKHFEMKRWILVDTSSEDESTQLEENLK